MECTREFSGNLRHADDTSRKVWSSKRISGLLVILRSSVCKPWMLFMLLFCLLHSSEALIKCGKCEGGSSIACPNTFTMKYEVRLLEYNGDPQGSLRLICDYSSATLDFSLMEGCNFSSVVYVRIDLCPMFSEPLSKIMHQIGVVPSKIKYLVWENSHSVQGSLQKWHLEGLEGLVSLEIHRNDFSSVEGDLLVNNSNLESLIINYVNIVELPSNLLSFTPNLTTVELTNGKINSIPDGFLSNVPKLEVFSATTNNLTSLNPSLFSNTPAINSINLSGNQISSIEAGLFSNLTNLTYVGLNINKLDALSDGAFTGSNKLKTLDLSYNNLGSLPSNIFKGTSLEFINLGFNNLTDIGTVFNNMKNLQNLTLHFNMLERLSSNAFTGSTNIVRLDFQRNKLHSLEEGVFKGLTKMRLILLNDNNLVELPERLFSECSSLLQVYMQNNNISTIPFSTFADGSSIRILKVSHNNLSYNMYDSHPFNKLTRIENLHLDNNKITFISSDFLYIFINLKLLDLSYNLISNLKDSDLSFVSQDLVLSLAYNKISSIEISPHLSMLNPGKSLKLRLEGNPFNCNCEMFQFLEYIQRQDQSEFELVVEDASSTKCSSPNELREASFNVIDPKKLVCEKSCSEECSCSYRKADNVLFMDCSDRMLTAAPRFTPNYIKNFNKQLNLILDFSGNDLENVDFLESEYFSGVTNLTLANNTINRINATSLPPALKFLDLRNNNLTTLPQSLTSHLNEAGINLYLSQNPWECDCFLQSFHEFLRDNFERIFDRSQILCAESGAPVEELAPEQLCPFLGQPAAVTGIVAVTLILILFAVGVTMAWYRHKEMVKVWLYSHNMCLWAITETEIDSDKKYDAFVSYSYKDESFVNNTLVPGLEAGDPPYRVCLHYRDWIPGEFIQDQILSSVKASRRTIVVLSKNFLESVWGQLEFKAAHSQALRDKTNRIIVVVYGELPGVNDLDGELKLYVSTNTYLKWGDQRFWERLRYAMPHAKYNKRVKKSKVDKLEMVMPAQGVDNIVVTRTAEPC